MNYKGTVPLVAGTTETVFGYSLQVRGATTQSDLISDLIWDLLIYIYTHFHCLYELFMCAPIVTPLNALCLFLLFFPLHFYRYFLCFPECYYY